MNVLVTGGAGYIGSHTCKSLKKNGFNPIVYDNLTRGHKTSVLWGELEAGDLSDTDKLIKVLDKHKIQAVLHFAAYAYVGESVNEPIKYYENNVLGTISLLKAMHISGVKKIIFSSSCATYGIPLSVPISEDHQQLPVNPYGKTKLQCEEILESACRNNTLSCISLRYFNASGSDRDLEIGELHDPETHLIPLAIQAAFDPNFQLTVLGNDYSTPDGTCLRDYIHVEDLAEAHVLALSKINQTQFGFKSYNLGAGKGYSVLEIIKTVEKIFGKKVNYKIGPRREGDPPILIAKCEKAPKDLNWNPKHSDIETIIKTAGNWYLKNKS